MVKLCLIQYLNSILMTLKLIYQIKATQGITGLNCIIAHIKWMVSHLDVGLSFSIFATRDTSSHGVLIHHNHMSWVQNDVNQFGLYLLQIITHVHLMNLRLHHSVRKDQHNIALAEFYNLPGPITSSNSYVIIIFQSTFASVQFLFNIR